MIPIERPKTRAALSAEQQRREQAEPVELNRVKKLLEDWLTHSDLPQIAALRQKPEPNIVVIGSQPDFGPQLGEVIKAHATVEQTPHGRYIDENDLRDPLGKPEQITPAFAVPPDLVVLPFTIDHFTNHGRGTFQVAGIISLKETILALRQLPPETITLVVSTDPDYKAIFEVLGLHAIKDQTLAGPEETPHGAGHLAAFERGETILDADTTALLRECDCMLGNIVMTLANGMLELYIDDHGISVGSLADFQTNFKAFQSATRRIEERYRRLQLALPEMDKHPNPAIRELFLHFSATAAEFPKLLQILEPANQAANDLVTAEVDGKVIDRRATVGVIRQIEPTVMAWFEGMKPLAKPIGASTIYQAYRMITYEVDRQEFSKGKS